MNEGEPHFSARQFIDYICRARNIEREDFGIWPDVIISYLGGFQKQSSHWAMRSPPAQFFSGNIVQNQAATMMAGPIGAPHAASIMEELKELGAERLWVLGYAGSLSPQFPLGALVGVDRAWSDEGTSAHYGRSGWASADANSKKLLTRSAPSLLWGANWTTDAVYRETPSKIQKFSDMGCQLVDMEASCYFHVGAVLGLQVAALMVVSDELYHAWRPGFGSPPVIEGIAAAYQLMSDVLDISPQACTRPL